MRFSSALTMLGLGFAASLVGCGGVSAGSVHAGARVRTLVQSNNNIVLNPVTGTLWASVPSTASSYSDCAVEINPATGAVLTYVLAGPEPNALAISSDGSTLFVGLDGSSSVCTVATAAQTVTRTFSVVPAGGEASEDISSIAVQPGSNSVIAVTRLDTLDTGDNGPEIISNGTILPNALGINQGQTIAFASSSQLYALDTFTTSFGLYDCAVNGSGVTVQSTQYRLFTGDETTILSAGGRIYGTDGTVLNAGTGAVLGSFAVTSGVGCAVDTANNLVFFLEAGAGASGNLLIQAFNLNTFAPVATAQLPNSLTGNAFSDLVRFGSAGLAFRSPTSVYFLDRAPGLGG